MQMDGRLLLDTNIIIALFLLPAPLKSLLARAIYAITKYSNIITAQSPTIIRQSIFSPPISFTQILTF